MQRNNPGILCIKKFFFNSYKGKGISINKYLHDTGEDKKITVPACKEFKIYLEYVSNMHTILNPSNKY